MDDARKDAKRTSRCRPATVKAVAAFGVVVALAIGIAVAVAATPSAPRFPTATKLALPAGARTDPDPFSTLRDVSCVRPGLCTAVGDYLDRSHNFHVMTAALSHGRWRPITLSLPAGATYARPLAQAASLPGVSCTGAGVCTAVGSY